MSGMERSISDTTVIIAMIPAAILVFLVLLHILYRAWYNKNYKTHYRSNEHDVGWDKCWSCKKAESEMYVAFDGIFGYIYKCRECSKKEVNENRRKG